jgi:hypothetical protein
MQQVESLADTPELRAVIEARAVFIHEVSRPVWAAVAEVSLEMLAAYHKRIVQSGLMKGDSYAHPLFCQAIRQTMPQARKQTLARRVIELVAKDNPLVSRSCTFRSYPSMPCAFSKFLRSGGEGAESGWLYLIFI